MIALKHGIAIAIDIAYKVAMKPGNIDGVKPMSSVNTKLYM